jgi:hypothetical protein
MEHSEPPSKEPQSQKHFTDERKVRIGVIRGGLFDYERANTRTMRLRAATAIVKWANALLEWEKTNSGV